MTKFRVVVSVLLGIFLLVESQNTNFAKPVVESRAPMVHLFFALFGIACLIQAAVLAKNLLSDQS
jgi:hypothetical protein